MARLNEATIRNILAAGGIFPSMIERNPLTRGEWVVWTGGLGWPVYNVTDVRKLSPDLSAADA